LLIDERRHRRKLPKKQSGLLACFSSDGPEEILDPEDLSIAVERRGAHTAGIRGALRLSDFESRRLAMFMAPKNTAGKVSKEEFSSFFRKPTKPLGEILDILIKPIHFGTIVDGYKKWFASEFNDKQLRLDYQTLRDEKVRFIAEQAWNRFIPPDADQSARPSDPSVGLEALFNIDWSCDENQSGENPFTSPSEVALVALHVGADDLADSTMFGDDQNVCTTCECAPFWMACAVWSMVTSRPSRDSVWTSVSLRFPKWRPSAATWSATSVVAPSMAAAARTIRCGCGGL
jgi:hypothetical protein